MLYDFDRTEYLLQTTEDSHQQDAELSFPFKMDDNLDAPEISIDLEPFMAKLADQLRKKFPNDYPLSTLKQQIVEESDDDSRESGRLFEELNSFAGGSMDLNGIFDFASYEESMTSDNEMKKPIDKKVNRKRKSGELVTAERAQKVRRAC